jgi:hypothetical protein
MSRMRFSLVFAPLGLGLCLLVSGSIVSSQGITAGARDPGVRPGPLGAGGSLPGLTGRQQQFFEIGKADFNEAEEVDEGLGPRMNLDGCGGCHIQPAIGGSSPRRSAAVARSSTTSVARCAIHRRCTRATGQPLRRSTTRWRISIPISWFTTWGSAFLMASARATQDLVSSGLRRSGDSGSASSSCTTAVLLT